MRLPKGSGLAAELVTVAAFVALLVYAAGWWSGHVDAKDAAEQARVDQLLRFAKPHHARNDSLRLVSKALAATGRQHLAAARTLNGFADSVRAALAAMPLDTVVPIVTVRRVVQMYETRTQMLHAAALSLDSALTVETERAELAETRVHDLEAALRVRPGRCRILVVPCPSRVASFVGGAVLGTVLTVWATKD